jgi:hypothetical protein
MPMPMPMYGMNSGALVTCPVLAPARRRAVLKGNALRAGTHCFLIARSRLTSTVILLPTSLPLQPAHFADPLHQEPRASGNCFPLRAYPSPEADSYGQCHGFTHGSFTSCGFTRRASIFVVMEPFPKERRGPTHVSNIASSAASPRFCRYVLLFAGRQPAQCASD